MELRGTVTTGLGRGSYYIGMDGYQERFHDILGFYPFAGTLNLEVDAAERQKFAEAVDTEHIDKFKEDGKYVSAVDVHKITVQPEHGGEATEAALLDLEITDHPDSVAEVIAPINLREEYDLDDGDIVICRTR